MKDEIQSYIDRALNGDEQAYHWLLERYKNGIYNLIYQMIKNHEETRDLVQETFIKAFNSLDSYNDKYAFSTWLYKIAYNHSIDAIRKKKLKTLPLDRPISLKEGDVKPQIGDESQSPERNMLLKEKQQMLDNVIEWLPERYREAIILRHKEERSYEEISEILDIPIGTVKARIFRAREMIKKKMREHL
ncbi:sigma-70 family RNA polymerase sigma factor [bacterium]|nr:sigma-70 family RNA polymerase sigma factor [bacterium]